MNESEQNSKESLDSYPNKIADVAADKSQSRFNQYKYELIIEIVKRIESEINKHAKAVR